ncbi:MAG TPA: hypothetical protein VGI19_03975 [Candidatus Cybelea sp.]|jgi:hypothetical protein
MSARKNASHKVGVRKTASHKETSVARVPATKHLALTGLYHVRAPAGASQKIFSALRAEFDAPVDVEEVRGSQNKVFIRQDSKKKALLDAENTEREFAARKALLAKARPIEEICSLLGIRSRQTIHNWISQRKIIALPENGRLMLPLWQFEAQADDKLVAGFSEAFRALKRTSFSAAHWFTNPNTRLGDKAPIALLRAGKIAEVVTQAELANLPP